MNRPAIAFLRKDLRITRVFWAPMAFSYVVFLLMFMENVWVYLAAGAALVFVAAATALAIDDRSQTDPLFAALPGTRRSQVAGRYLAWGVVTMAGLALFLASTILFDAALAWRSARLGSLLSLRGAAAFLIGAALAGLVFLPFYFRFGFWRGLWAFLGAGFVLAVIAINASARLVPAEACALDPASALPGPLVSTARGLRALAWLIDRQFSRPPVLAAAAVFAATLAVLSYQLSVRFFEKRDL